ncbi:MAG: hypothetical protein AAFW75_01305 [Cyanobacteria bacterium J06636_16]
MANLMWIEGATRSGKTDRLLSYLATLATAHVDRAPDGAVFLVFAANGDNRLVLADRLADVVPANVPVTTATPAGFIQNEVTLFWPVLVESLGLSPQFPLKLHPENEQELATQVWRPELDGETLTVPGWTEAQTVRRSLDFLQLAASGGIPAENLTTILPEGMPPGLAPIEVWRAIGDAVVRWRDWCLSRGFLTYGIATELYWRHLLPHPTYQAKFAERFCGVLADDLDEYPAIFHDLLAAADALELPTAVTWNPHGKVRLGIGADPDYLAHWQDQATDVETVSTVTPGTLADDWADAVVASVLDPNAVPEPPDTIQLIQATSRGELLRQTAEAIAEAIHTEQVTPGDIAVIGPGFDAIARYTLAAILQKQQIPVASLNDQRPLVSTPLVRSVLTLIPFIYPGLGRLLDRDAVAEMLVVLSQSAQGDPNKPWFERVQIDPVRAELIADHCFQPDPEQPELLEVTEFPRWDRLGYQATEAYNTSRDWILRQRQDRQQRLITSPVNLMDRAIQAFLWRGNYLPYDQLAALRELMETAQHFWEVEGRLRQQRFVGQKLVTELSPEGRFLRLLQQGIVTANPFPVKPLEHGQQGVMLSTVFQYRSQRLTHRWQFWLDAGSPRWLTGTDELFGYPIFLRNCSGRPWTVEFIEDSHEARLERILRDLLGRATERVILCHSDLAVNGQEQTGPLLTLVNIAEEYSRDVVVANS